MNAVTPIYAPREKYLRATQDVVIQVTDLKKSFGSNHVLKGLSFNLMGGENLIVLGRSGSGKSVLIKCIVQLIKQDAGEIKVLGKDICLLGDIDLDIIRQRIGFLFQSSALYDSMTVRENLEFPLRRTYIRKNKRTIRSRVEEALENVGLANAINLMPAELSGGMRKRIGLARTLIMEPEIMLYDEPTTGLDPITAKEITELILEIQQRYNTASIIISHDMDCVKLINGRIIMLIDGINYAEGTYSQLASSTDKQVKAFFE
jgi:phospholipid/cholesterol/gamma-HCH transport system ATP-binding protein